jgi:hypothetical protein
MERPELREFVDLDILIPGSRVADLIAALEAVGIEQINQNWAAYVKHGVAEFPVQIDGVQIDVHWHLIPLRRTRRQFSIDIDAMLERRRRITFQGVEFPALDVVDHLIHVCVHAGVSGANKGGWLRDVAAAMSSTPGVESVAERAASFGALPLVAQVLDRVGRQQLASIAVTPPTQLADRRCWSGGDAATPVPDHPRPTSSACSRGSRWRWHEAHWSLPYPPR